jgi:hypothetical protein
LRQDTWQRNGIAIIALIEDIASVRPEKGFKMGTHLR